MRTINREEILVKLGHVVVLKGGASAEREISLMSGQAVYEGLQRLGIQSTVIDVGDDIINALNAAKPDLVFNMLHGKGGEDGVIQGLLEVMKISYTGSGVLASALAMDKVKSKLVWQSLGLSTADFFELNDATDLQAVIDSLGKVVVKPVGGGSSLGIAIVDSAEELRREYQNAKAFDAHIMAEQWIQGREFSTGVLDDEIFPTVQLETKRKFFDFDAKYMDEDTKVLCPPDIPVSQQDELDRLVRDAYVSLGCSGLARVDVMQDREGKFYLLELNTVPGMTSHSFVPMAAQSVGLSFDDLLLKILDAEVSESRQ
jgi:D-alanine-D-alanine ligase